MDVIDPAVMLVQAGQLGADLRRLTLPVAEQIDGLLAPDEWTSIDRVYLTGDGDSYHAGLAAQWAFTTIAGIDCQALSAQRLLSYGPDLFTRGPRRRALVIGTSASGDTERVGQVLAQARDRGAMTLALTGRPGSLVTQAAEHRVVVELADSQPSPGLRTYQGSLLGLLLIAVHLNGERHPDPEFAPKRLHNEILALADIVDATVSEIGWRCEELGQTVARAGGDDAG